jgi:hypothetical protein
MGQGFFEGFSKGFLNTGAAILAEKSRQEAEWAEKAKDRLDQVSAEKELYKYKSEMEAQRERDKAREELQAVQLLLGNNLGEEQIRGATDPKMNKGTLGSVTTPNVDISLDQEIPDTFLQDTTGTPQKTGGEAFASATNIRGNMEPRVEPIQGTNNRFGFEETPEITKDLESSLNTKDLQSKIAYYRKEANVDRRAEETNQARIEAAKITQEGREKLLAIPPEVIDARKALAAEKGLPFDERAYSIYTDREALNRATENALNPYNGKTYQETVSTMRAAIPEADKALEALRKDPNMTGLSLKAQLSDLFKRFDTDVASLKGSQSMFALLEKGIYSFPGSLSDADREFLKTIVIDFDKDAAANKNNLLGFKEFAQRRLDYDNTRQDYIQTVSPNTSDFENEWAEYLKANPYTVNVGGKTMVAEAPGFTTWVKDGKPDNRPQEVDNQATMNSDIPEGVTTEEWQFMKPEERALF